MDFLVVDLDKTAPYQVFFIGLRIGQSDNLMKSSGNDTFGLLTFITAHHGMRLTTSGLSICKNGAVISFEYIIDKCKSSLFVYITLKGINTEYTIETEGFGWLLGISFEQFYLVGGGIDLYNSFTTLIRFEIPLYFYLVLMGRHLTMTLTASVIWGEGVQIGSRNLKFLLLIWDSILQ